VWLGVWLKRKNGSDESSNFRTMLLCLSWMATSVGMHTLNKDLVLILDAPSCITALQMCMAALVMFVFFFGKIRDVIQNYPWQAVKWCMVPAAFSGMLLSSFFTYKHVTLCVMTVVRNLAPLIALPVELYIMPENKRPRVSMESIGAMCVMLAGAVIYGLSAPEISAIGIGFAVLNMLLAIFDRTLQRSLIVQECKDLHLEYCTFLNNIVGTVPAISLALFTHEFSLVSLHQVNWLDPGIIFLLAISGLVGIGICYFGIAVQKCISATSFLVLQNVSKFAVVFVGIALFGDPIESQFIVVGLACSLGGSCWYGKSQVKAASDGEQKPLVEKKTNDLATPVEKAV